MHHTPSGSWLPTLAQEWFGDCLPHISALSACLASILGRGMTAWCLWLREA
jgi:hypothetical protein